MKYQFILNNVIIFETDNVSEYFSFLLKPENVQIKNSVLYDLLEKSKSYTADMATQ